MRSLISISILLFASIAILISCKEDATPTIKEMSLDNVSWLLGEWQINGNEHYEKWEKVGNSHLYAVNYRVAPNGNVVEDETIELKQDNGRWMYVPKIQKEGFAVSTIFMKTNEGVDTLIFENPTHDYPKKVVYINQGENDAMAYLEGGGKRIEFKMKRITEEK